MGAPAAPHGVTRRISAVFFDIGGTLVDETRQWSGWARYLGVGDAEFFAALGVVIEAGRPTNDVFSYFCRGDIDPPRWRRARMDDGEADEFTAGDVFADAGPCLAELRRRGLTVGIAGNQPPHRSEGLRALGLAADHYGTSSEWAVEKPAAAFFERIVQEAGAPAAEIAYVGDRLDNDVLPAIAAGMAGVFLPRGPWGIVQARWPQAASAQLTVDSLEELPAALAHLPPAPRPGGR